MKWVLVVALVVVAGLGLAVFLNEPVGKKVPKVPKLDKKFMDVGEDFLGGENASSGDFDGSGSSGGGGLGGSGSGGGSSGSLGDSCLGEQVSYSLGEFTFFEECLSYSWPTCTQKNVSCSSLVTNLDESNGGEFRIKFSYFYYLGTDRVEVGSEIKSKNIGPLNSSTFYSSKVFSGADAGRNLNCVALKDSAPRKKIC